MLSIGQLVMGAESLTTARLRVIVGDPIDEHEVTAELEAVS